MDVSRKEFFQYEAVVLREICFFSEKMFLTAKKRKYLFYSFHFSMLVEKVYFLGGMAARAIDN